MQIVADDGRVATVYPCPSPLGIIVGQSLYARPTSGYARVIEPDEQDVIGILTMANFTVEEIPS